MAFNYYPQFFQQAPAMPSVPQQGQIQNGGFVSVPSEVEARNYPVAYGNSVTFKNENAPYIYTKTMGFSQMDPPKFEKFRLVKEVEAEDPAAVPEEKKKNEDIERLEAEMEKLKTELEDLKMDLEDVTNSVNIIKKKASTTKKEA